MNNRFIHPRYYTSWILVFCLKLFVRLPYKWQMKTGRFIGRKFYKLAKRRYKITYRNLQLCFPDKSTIELEKLCQQSFEALCMSGIETVIAWFMPDKKFRKIYLDKQFSKDFISHDPNHAMILLGGHFSCMEIMGRLMASNLKNFNVSFIYQKHKSDFFEYIMTSSRSRYAKLCIQRKNVFSIIKNLLRGETIWYAPDQDFGNERTLFVPFFKIPCATLTATSWLAKNGKSDIIPCYYIRKKDLSGYEIHIMSKWQNFPSGNVHDDAERYNQFLENIILRYPDQYLWQHRRFKTRPNGGENLYQ